MGIRKETIVYSISHSKLGELLASHGNVCIRRITLPPPDPTTMSKKHTADRLLLEPDLIQISTNMDGISRTKQETLTKIFNSLNIAAQKALRDTNAPRPSLREMIVSAAFSHDCYGSTIFVKPNQPIT